MHVRKALPAVLGVALFVSPVLFASSLHLASPMHAALGHTKSVKFDIRNSSATPVELRIGDKVQTVEAGKTVSLNLPVGTHVTANKATPMLAEGAIIAEAQAPLSGNTVVIH